MTRRAWPAALVLALALMSGCGSTLSPAQRAARLQPGQQRRDEFGNVVTPAGAGSTNDTTAADAIGGNPSASGATSRTVTGTRNASGVSGPAFGPGVTADSIYVGLSYASNNTANAAIGAPGLGQGDGKAEDQAMIDDINAHGGIAGHKVQPVFHPVDPNSASPWDVIDQQSCDDWTQDHKVFAVLAEPLADSDTMASCLDKRGVALITTALSTSDTARFRRFPSYVELTSINLDRIATAEVDALQAQGWFGGWDTAAGAASPARAKVGVVTYEGAAWSHAVDQVLVPALRAAGYAPASQDIIRVPSESATSDTAQSGAATSSAVLKLRGDGVTHVIVFDRKGTLTLFFTRAANSQRYRPRYGLNTQNGPQALMDGAALPAEQLVGSRGIGWLPSLDLPGSVARSAAYTNDTKRKCLAVFKAKNITFTDANAESIGMNTCSSWWFLRDAINASGGVLTRTGLIDGIGRLGTSFQTASNLGTRFSPSQHDGVGAFRYYAFDGGCGCMKYTSNNVAAP